jgi:hypothetical protein
MPRGTAGAAKVMMEKVPEMVKAAVPVVSSVTVMTVAAVAVVKAVAAKAVQT